MNARSDLQCVNLVQEKLVFFPSSDLENHLCDNVSPILPVRGRQTFLNEVVRVRGRKVTSPTYPPTLGEDES